MKNRAAAIGLILVMAFSLGACGGKKNAEKADTASEKTVSIAEETEAAGEDTAGADAAGAAGTNMTGAAGANMTEAAGSNMTGAPAVNAPIMLDPPSLKTAYQPETEDQKYARELTGIYLLTDLKDSLSGETSTRASQMESEGRPMYIEFFANGTMRETVFGDPMGGLWDKEYLTLGAQKVPYTFSGDHLTITTDNMDLTFTRTTKEELELLLTSGSDEDEAEEDSVTEDSSSESDESDESSGLSDTETDISGEDLYAEDYYAKDTADDGAIEDPIIEDDLCRMTVTGYDFNDPRGFVIHTLCENYSIYNLNFNITECMVDNIMFEPVVEGEDHWTLDVPPMSASESDIVFRADLAAEYGITSFDYVMLNLWVRNVDQWMDDPIYSGDTELYPTGKLSGEGIQTLKRRSAAGEQKIAEESKFTFTILGSEVRENGDFVLKACIENTTYSYLSFNWDDVYVNGYLLDPFWSTEVLPNSIDYEDIVFSVKDLQEKGVSTPTDITFTMTAYDTKDWLSYGIYTETSTYRV